MGYGLGEQLEPGLGTRKWAIFKKRQKIVPFWGGAMVQSVPNHRFCPFFFAPFSIFPVTLFRYE